jgi:hypothetical protein
LAEPINTPNPISRRVLDKYLANYYGPGKSIFIEGVGVSDVRACNLSDAGGGTWAHTPPAGKVAIDPVFGRIAFGDAQATPPLVTFHYGFSADMGGGEYERADTFDALLQPVEKIPAPHATIQGALNAVTGGGVAEISDSGRYLQTPSISANAGKRVELRAANERRPTVVLGGDLLINGGADSEVTLNGLLIIGGTVCLGPGIFILRESPVSITGAQSLRVRRHGWRTILARIGGASAITVENSLGVVVEEMTVLTSAAANDFGAAVSLSNSVGVTLQRDVILRLGDSDRGGPAIGASGLLVGTLIRENVVFGPTGIGNLLVQSSTSTGAPTVQPAPVLTAALAVQDNSLFCSRSGVSFDGLSLHTLETWLAGNFVNDSPQGGIVAKGWAPPGSGVDVCDNEIHANGQAIVVGVDGARVNSNDISPAQARRGEGIVLTTGLDRSGLDRCQVLGNRVTGVGGNGISILANVRSAMIKNNVIEAVGGGGIVMGNESSAGVLSIENNQLLNIAPQANDDKTEVVGIRVVQAARAEIAANSVVGVGRAALQGLSRVGIEVIATTSARVAGNEVAEIGPAAEFIGGAAGIACLGTFERLDVTDNNVSRGQTTPANPGASSWIAVLLRGPSKSVETASSATFLIASESTAFVFLGNRLLALPRGREIVGVNGNLLEVYGGRESSAMLVRNVGALSFNHNRCLLTSTEQSVAVVARAVVRAAIASSNYLQGEAQNIALDLHLPETGPFTVVGNITSGPIRINNHELPPPWAPLNVIAR